MPWIAATLRGQAVLARANADGSLAAEGGRVEVRYKPNDGRAYRAAAQNVEVSRGATVLSDDTCGPAEAPAPKGSGAAKGAGPARGSSATKGATSVVDERGAWVAYTDGACSGNPGPAGCGVVLISPDGRKHELFEYLGSATNNVAELTGILRAVEWAPSDAQRLVVRTDSQYAIGVLQKGWKAKVNQELVARAKRLVEARGARLVYVPGHQGVALNERADELAREAVQTRRRHRDELAS
jgi:ribonuclease HI